MHGEYKTPGGKLVVADFTVVDNRLADVTISGDFFLYPEEALQAIVGALAGMRANAPAEELARQIQAALPPEATLLGFSPAGIARAVRRGLGEA